MDGKASNELFLYNTSKEHTVCFTLFTPKAVHNTHGLVLVSGYLIIAVSVLLTNITLIVGLFKTNNALSLAQRLFVLMSAMDLVIGLVFMPLQIYMILTSERQRCELIMIQAFVSMFFPFMSGLILLLIVMHRFFLVVNTQFTKKLAHRRNIRICLAISMLFSASMSSWYAYQKRTSHHVAHGTYYLTAGVITSGYLVIVTLVNLRLVCFLKTAAKTGASQSSISSKRGTYHKHVSKTLAMMSAVVTLCYLPMTVSFIVSGVILLRQLDWLDIVSIIIPWSQMVMTLNSALNSYIYIVRTKSISNYYKRILKRYCFVGKVNVGRSIHMRNWDERTEKSEVGSAKF